MEFNDFEFIDYMIIANTERFNKQHLVNFINQFGKILEFKTQDGNILIRFCDIRAIKEI
jgi:hypothetical protein